MIKFLLKDILNLPQINQLFTKHSDFSLLDDIESLANNYINSKSSLAWHFELQGTPETNLYKNIADETAVMTSGNHYRLGLWVWDVIKDEVRFGSEYYKIIGSNRGDFLPTIKSWIDMIHTDDRELAVIKLLESIYKKKKYYTHEYRLKTSDSEWKTLLCKARMFDSLEDNNSIFMVWLHMDAIQIGQVADVNTLFSSAVK